MSGYDYKSEALTQMTSKLRKSAQNLAKSASSAPPAPDAGDSSAILAEVISDLLKSGAAIAAKQESIAGKIHASNGTYDDVENTNTDALKQAHREEGGRKWG
ncbi:hypothetical protein [Sciscionella marina]|uniref:hypothetical protein n=1 Tax=Sciscionella marina TaxID=508770 RepID=UPI000379DDAD|nr:hypothetical protein [Sciscionella marina]